MRDSSLGHPSGAFGALVGVALALLAAPSTSRAFTREFASGTDGPCLFWNARQLAFATNDKGSHDAGGGAFAAVSASFAAWTATGCSDIQFQDRGRTTSMEVGYSAQEPDRPTLVVWRETLCSSVAKASDPCWKSGSCANTYGCWDHDPGMIALTTTTFNHATGEVVHADIELNGASFVFTAIDSPPCDKEEPVSRPSSCVAVDVQNTLTHEVGHLLGLDHSLDTDATMFHTADLGETQKRDIDPDDAAGLCFIYPKSLATSTCLSPVAPTPKLAAGGCQSASSGDAPALIPGLLVWLRRRGRSARPR